MSAAAPPILVERARGRGALILSVACAAALLAGALLFFFNPAEHAFYPRCFLKVATGLDCPGCGGLRATHQLLHGNVREAFTLNPLFVIAMPAAAIFLGCAFVEKLTGKRFPRFLRATTATWLAAAVVIAFGVLRNLPWRVWFNS